tara:strand:- start:2255 stop:2398 length:144 start_codon:yes stop_codon:yes gene_type:complete
MKSEFAKPVLPGFAGVSMSFEILAALMIFKDDRLYILIKLPTTLPNT